MYTWNVLLDIKTDLSLQEFHSEKINSISELSFHKQVQNVDGDIQVENKRLVQLLHERNEEKQSNFKTDGLMDDEEPKTKPKDEKSGDEEKSGDGEKETGDKKSGGRDKKKKRKN